MRKNLTRTALATATCLLTVAPLLHAQQGTSPSPQQTNIAPSTAGNQTAATPTWSTDQLLTSTVHQAWLLSGKNEATFFEMVTQLAEISARNRNLQLPESAEAGRQVGEMIKTAAKQDTDQLLFAVVDAAVRKVGTPLPASSAR